MWSVASIPGELPDNLRTLYQAYFLVPDRIGFGAAALALEGLGLMAATATLFRARPRLANALPIAMVSSAVVAAAASALLYRGIGFAPVLEEHALIVGRTSAHVGDPNAAASYFGMMLFVAAGMAAEEDDAPSGALRGRGCRHAGRRALAGGVTHAEPRSWCSASPPRLCAR